MQNQEQLCRFYEEEYPPEDKLVIGKVIEVEQNGCYVQLLEYGGKRGLITPNQYTTLMQKAIRKAIKPNAEQVVRVVKVDKEKGYIDLSKKKVDQSEIVQTADQYAKAKTVQSIARSVAGHVKVPLQQVLKLIVWPIYKNQEKPLEIFKEFLENEALIKDYNLSPQIEQKLLTEIRRRFEPPVIKINAKFEIKINDFEGINTIKSALTIGKAKSRPNFQLSITILGAPVYLITLQTRKRKQGIQVVNEGMEAIRKFVKEKGGLFKVKEAATVVKDKTKDEGIEEEEIVADDGDSEGMGEGELDIDEIETADNTSASSKEV